MSKYPTGSIVILAISGPNDVIFYVIKGSIEIFIDDEKFIVHENDCIEVPKNTYREVENKHDIKAEFLIFRLT